MRLERSIVSMSITSIFVNPYNAWRRKRGRRRRNTGQTNKISLLTLGAHAQRGLQ